MQKVADVSKAALFHFPTVPSPPPPPPPPPPSLGISSKSGLAFLMKFKASKFDNFDSDTKVYMTILVQL